MKKNLIKVSVALTLGSLLVGGNTSAKAYASEASSQVNKELTAKENYEAILNQVNLSIEKYQSELQGYKFKNSSKESQIQFMNALEGLKKIYDQAKVANPEDDASYNKDADTIQISLNLVNKAYQNLDGKEVDKSEILGLLGEQSNFQKKVEYKNAPKELQDTYNKAISDTFHVLSTNGQQLSNEENDEAIKKISNAKDEIINYYKRKTTINNLREELNKSNEIRSNKSLYTDKTYRAYNNAVVLAKSTIENPNSKIEELESAIDVLSKARNSLEKSPTQKDKERQAQIEKLEEAIKKNETTKESAKLVIKIAKNTAKKNMDYLQKLINDSEAILVEARKTLNYLKGIKG